MQTGVLDQNWIRNFFRSIDYPIGLPSKIYKNSQETITIVLADRITPQARYLNILITALHELHLRKTFDMVDPRSNMHLANLNYKPHVGKSLINTIDCAISARFYPPPGPEHYKILCLYKCHEPSHINFDQNNKSEIRMGKISNAHNFTTKPCANQI